MRNKNKFKNLIWKIKFKSINLSFPKQLAIIWSFLWLISLFFNWVEYPAKSESWNAFNSSIWWIWFILTIVYLLPIFIIFSNQYKEKIKLYSELNFKNHFIIITAALVSLSFSFISINFVSWLNTFLWNINYWNWPILSMTSWVLILIAWIIIRQEFNKNNSEIILEKMNISREKNKENDNMSLPI